eukprot:CAMPEP_0114493396 /NCGR_PEP_ID=MMETSP0109-20121206/4085_1 /TAXON_ID=29199 /ORGANISM="Chlorarachnion reptans, Strain CCCM449" /LENGTH=39 /DNA_ID= /DNA_START= /DNA_END= /DNA_ORIENTATION=
MAISGKNQDLDVSDGETIGRRNGSSIVRHEAVGGEEGDG